MNGLRRWLVVGLTVALVLGLGSAPAISQADYSQLFKQLAPSVVWVTAPEQDKPRLVTPIGSGFIAEVNAGQLGIVTACHVAIQGPQATVDGQQQRILRVFPNPSRSSTQGILTTVSECDRIRDVAVLRPIQPMDENAYRTVDFPTRLESVRRAWLASDPPQVGERAFVFGFPGPNAEFNASFGQVSSWLKRIYLRGDATRYQVSQDGGTCEVQRTIHQDGVFVLTHVGQVRSGPFPRPKAGIPLKWGLSTLKEQAEDGDRVLARSNLGLPVPLPRLGPGLSSALLSSPFAGTIAIDEATGTLRVEEVPWRRLRARPVQGTCQLVGLPSPAWGRTTDQALRIAAERDVFSIDAAVRGGNSGGPVFNASGQVIGLVVRGNVEGGHYSTTAADIRRVLSEVEW